jgi:lipoprotein-anchoring transpeptidase ErfK/SrfK
MSNVAISGVKPTVTPAPQPKAAPAKPIPPEKNPHRWMVPDRALVDARIGTVPDADKQKYKLVADLVKSRIYVVDKTTNEAVDAYLTSPGTDKYPTKGTKFTITKVMPMAWWNPPSSDWAKNAKPAPPGPENPMGVLKLNLGAYGQYIHGIPKHEERALGTHASHGCMRMSNGNVIDLYQHYATVGTVVEVNRDKTLSKALASKYAAAGHTVHLKTDGNDLIDDVVEATGPNQ